MAEHGLHRGLELRLVALAERIAALRDKEAEANGPELIEEFGEIKQLEERERTLKARLDALNREGPGFRQNTKAELEKAVDDLSGAVVTAVVRGPRTPSPEEVAAVQAALARSPQGVTPQLRVRFVETLIVAPAGYGSDAGAPPP